MVLEGVPASLNSAGRVPQRYCKSHGRADFQHLTWTRCAVRQIRTSRLRNAWSWSLLFPEMNIVKTKLRSQPARIYWLTLTGNSNWVTLCGESLLGPNSEILRAWRGCPTRTLDLDWCTPTDWVCLDRSENGNNRSRHEFLFLWSGQFI